MSKRYVIQNCPAYIHRPLNNHNMVCLLQNELRPEHKNLYVYCQEITDCRLKQIVEKCKKYIENYNDKVFYDEDDVKILMGKVMLSQFILSEVLDIQEVE